MKWRSVDDYLPVDYTAHSKKVYCHEKKKKKHLKFKEKKTEKINTRKLMINLKLSCEESFM